MKQRKIKAKYQVVIRVGTGKIRYSVDALCRKDVEAEIIKEYPYATIDSITFMHVI